jgi:hypothetical protein
MMGERKKTANLKNRHNYQAKQVEVPVLEIE